MTPNCGGTTRCCAGPQTSSRPTTSSTSVAAQGRRPARPRGRRGPAARSAWISPRRRSTTPASWPTRRDSRNVTFARADAQVHHFPQQHFDLAISRFGTMFFGDPVAAFSNIGRALRPAGRLVMMVWQARELNEWAVVIRQCLEAEAGRRFLSGPDAFSLADQRRRDGHPARRRIHRRHLRRRRRTGLLRPRRGRGSRLDPRLHLHERKRSSGWVRPPRPGPSSGCEGRSPPG